MFIRKLAVEGLSLNAAKCEIVCDDMTSCGTLLVALPGAQLIKESQAQLLGSPLVDEECISVALAEKVEELQRLGKRLQMLTVMHWFCCGIVFPCPSYCTSSGLLHVSDRPPLRHMMIACVRF